MPAPKQPPEQQPGKAGQQPAKSGRKPWKKKSPVDVMNDQAEKLKAEIAETEEELKQKRKQLAKFEEAKKLFEAT